MVTLSDEQMKPLRELPVLSSQIAREYSWQIERMGRPPKEPRLRSDARKIFAAVQQGDGTYAEAIAAVMWHCHLSAEQTEAAIGDFVHMGRTSR